MSFTLPTSRLSLAFEPNGGIAKLFSLEAELNCAIRFERALSKAQSALGIIPPDHARQISEALELFHLDQERLIAGIARDGLYVPELVRQIRASLSKDISASFHKDTTSQDVIDTSLMLRMQTAFAKFDGNLTELIEALKTLQAEIGERQISARTRMQSALPFTLADRIDGWLDPLKSLKQETPTIFPLQLGGPIGMMHKQEEKWKELVKAIASDLDLSTIFRPWHTDRRELAGLCHWLTSLTTALGKIGYDISLMVQNGIDEIALKDGGSSSAMPHKNNPVLAEVLVASAKYNAGQMGLLHNSAIHEQERSGTSWTMEFMIVPQIVLTCDRSLSNAKRLVAQLN